MTGEILGAVIIFLLTIVLAYPLGKFIAKVFKGEKNFMDFMNPLERFIFRVSGINPNESMNWKQFLKAMLTINLLWLVYAMLLLIFQDKLPLNPDGNPGQTPDLAFNTAISFLVNCNLQHYSGESGLTYFTQLFVITFLQFLSAATGIACLIALFNGLKEKTTNNLGNFWNYLVKSTTRILFPLSVIVAIILAFNGTPTSYDAKDSIVTLQGDSVQVSRGPAAGNDRH
jgi:K+-transporting ATPase ATPase A chain